MLGGGGPGYEFNCFTKGVLSLRPKSRVVNSVSGENLHDFEIISPGRGMRTHPRTPAPHASHPPLIVNILYLFVFVVAVVVVVVLTIKRFSWFKQI